jgi:hypothetical protein
MKPILSNLRTGRATGSSGSSDSLGRGMDTALTLFVFFGIGALIDSWLGVFPVFTIVLVVLAAVGTFIRMKFVYDAEMERHEAELRASRQARSNTIEEAA